MPAMIYHAPFPLNRQAKAASGIRPVRMYDAFVELGYEVIDLTGTGSQRRQALKDLRRRLKAGLVVDFLYSESATIPTMLTEPRHIPLHPFLDPALLKLCRKYGIPTSLFYRDMYWAFDSYLDLVSKPVATVMRSLYRYDLRWYSRYVSRLYVPSMRMGQEIKGYPISSMEALPPGTPVTDIARTDTPYDLELLYVGGMSDHYRLHELVRAVAALPRVALTICTHENQWKNVQSEYQDLLNDNIRIVHESGEGLFPLYARADIACLYVEPDDYRTFAAPVKLFEYLGHGKPVLCSEGTLAAQLIETEKCGWVIPYGAQAAQTLLNEIVDNPSAIQQIAQTVAKVRHQHTWKARAQKVVDDMATLRNAR